MYVLVALLLTPFTACLNGWALSKLWAWFVAPLFDVPLLSIPEAIGLSVIVSYLTWFHVDAQPKDQTVQAMAIEGMILSVVTPLFSVFLGWIVQGFL